MRVGGTCCRVNEMWHFHCSPVADNVVLFLLQLVSAGECAASNGTSAARAKLCIPRVTRVQPVAYYLFHVRFTA